MAIQEAECRENWAVISEAHSSEDNDLVNMYSELIRSR